MYNIQFTRRNFWCINYVIYCSVRGLVDYLMLSWVVDSRGCFDFSRPIPHFFASRLELKPWWCLSVYVSYPIIFRQPLTLLISMLTIISQANTMEKFYIALSNSWSLEFSLHWAVGYAHVIFIVFFKLTCQWKFELVLYSSSNKYISTKLFDGSQWNSSDGKTHWYLWSSSSVGGWVMSPKLYPSADIGIKRSSDASITNFLCGSVRSLHIFIPRFWHWVGLVIGF